VLHAYEQQHLPSFDQEKIHLKVLIFIFEQIPWSAVKPRQTLHLQNRSQQHQQQSVAISFVKRQRLLVLAQFPPPFLDPALFSNPREM
jgi:hypothetical protein